MDNSKQALGDNYNVGDIMDRFSKLDYMTQRTIINEFPSIFPEYQKRPIDTTPIEHFPPRKFVMNDFFGGFILVISIITFMGEILPYVIEWIF